MRIIQPLILMEVLKKNIEPIKKNSIFPQEAKEMAQLHHNYYELLLKIKELKDSTNDQKLSKILSDSQDSIDISMKLLIEAIAYITERRIIIHQTSKSDNIWKVARSYDVEVHELFELNIIRKLFYLDENRPILIPLKDTASKEKQN